jgi:hypothetical protein
MLDEFFGMFGSHPKFRRGQLVIVVEDSVDTMPLYKSIERRRWLRPTDSSKKTWVYCGDIFKLTTEGLVYDKYGNAYPESDLKRIRGSAYPSARHGRNFKSNW